MKKQFNVRLREEAVMKIKGRAEEWGCSEAEAVERLAEGVSVGPKLPEGTKKRVAELAEEMGLSEGTVLEMAVMEFRGKPKLDTSPLRYLGRAGDPGYSFAMGGGNGSTAKESEIPDLPKTDKRAVFEALKAKIAGGGTLDAPVEEKPLSETPVAPFAFMMDGEEHKIMQSGKKLGIYYVELGEHVFTRYLKEGELEQLWEKRIR